MAVAQNREAAFETVFSAFTDLENDNSLCDTIFRVGNAGNEKDFHVVSPLFATQSPYFKSLLFGRLQEAQPSMDVISDNSQSISSTENLISRPKKFVRLDDISPKAFQYVKLFFYCKKPTLNKSIVPNVAYFAKKYLLTSLYKLSVAFISNLPPNDIQGFLKVLKVLHEHGLKDETMNMAHS